MTMTDKKLILGMGLIDGYGGLRGAWRAPHVDPGTYADVDATVRHARAAERMVIMSSIRWDASVKHQP